MRNFLSSGSVQSHRIQPSCLPGCRLQVGEGGLTPQPLNCWCDKLSCGLCLMTNFRGVLVFLRDDEEDTINWAEFCGNDSTGNVKKISRLFPVGLNILVSCVFMDSWSVLCSFLSCVVWWFLTITHRSHVLLAFKTITSSRPSSFVLEWPRHLSETAMNFYRRTRMLR